MERPIDNSNRLLTLFHMVEKNRAGIEAPKKLSRFCEKFHEILVWQFLISLHGDEVEQIWAQIQVQILRTEKRYWG